ncbi:MAG: PLDc N-terminal domain-containing protein [Gemmatimonadetes bacterium]|nr:PLDc N-terminal domain-containing protein [Gemmatimonadota bacterium]
MRLLLGILVLVLDAWAILSILGSRASALAKLLWILAIVVFPVVGFLAWLLLGPRPDLARPV